MRSNPFPEVQAPFSDVFSTVADWRNGVAHEAERIDIRSTGRLPPKRAISSPASA
jgi:hypothetical protein